ncbi:hypothetical protein GO011_11560 [Mycobacterium sp. 20091114027_K0903767]|nr:hypothetical protein [Mycobacterium sp. 20091114027_K0903767]
MARPAEQMRTATESAYLLDHPGDADGATVAGWLAAQQIARRADAHAIAVISPETQAALSLVDVSAISIWLDCTWGDITGTIADFEVIA